MFFVKEEGIKTFREALLCEPKEKPKNGGILGGFLGLFEKKILDEEERPEMLPCTTVSKYLLNGTLKMCEENGCLTADCDLVKCPWSNSIPKNFNGTILAVVVKTKAIQ